VLFYSKYPARVPLTLAKVESGIAGETIVKTDPTSTIVDPAATDVNVAAFELAAKIMDPIETESILIVKTVLAVADTLHVQTEPIKFVGNATDLTMFILATI
jgi:hypothetical protein